MSGRRGSTVHFDETIFRHATAIQEEGTRAFSDFSGKTLVDTIDESESRSKEVSQGPLHVTFSQQVDSFSLPSRSDGQEGSYLVGGKFASDENSFSADNVTKVDIDMPLTRTERMTNNGEEFIVLYFAEGDQEDPFNWNPRRKAFIAVVLCLMTLSIGLATTAYSSGIVSMCAEFDVDVIMGQLGLFLFNFTCALAPLLLAPFCELVGRRIVYAGSYVCFAMMFIGLSLGKNIGTILACRALLGLFGCVGTILVGGTFSDMYPGSELAIPIASFSWIAILGTVGAPIYAGFINMKLGWRWIEGIQGLANIPLLLVVVFCLRETRGEVVLQKRAKVIRKATGDNRYVSIIEMDARNIKDLLHSASVKAIKMLATEWVVFAFGLWIAFAWFTVFLFLSVIPITFTEKRGWNEGIVAAGLPYISLCIGVTLAYGANFINMKRYKKWLADPDIQVVPEHRLYGAMYGAIWLPIGLFIYTFTQYGYLPWIGPVFALAPISFGIFFIFESVYSYTADCYGSSSSSAIAGQGLMRNTLGAVSPLFATQFFHNLGSQYAGLILALISCALSTLPFIMFKTGRKLRSRSLMAAEPEKEDEKNTYTSARRRRMSSIHY